MTNIQIRKRYKQDIWKVLFLLYYWTNFATRRELAPDKAIERPLDFPDFVVEAMPKSGAFYSLSSLFLSPLA